MLRFRTCLMRKAAAVPLTGWCGVSKRYCSTNPPRSTPPTSSNTEVGVKRRRRRSSSPRQVGDEGDPAKDHAATEKVVTETPSSDSAPTSESPDEPLLSDAAKLLSDVTEESVLAELQKMTESHKKFLEKSRSAKASKNARGKDAADDEDTSVLSVRETRYQLERRQERDSYTVDTAEILDMRYAQQAALLQEGCGGAAPDATSSSVLRGPARPAVHPAAAAALSRDPAMRSTRRPITLAGSVLPTAVEWLVERQERRWQPATAEEAPTTVSSRRRRAPVIVYGLPPHRVLVPTFFGLSYMRQSDAAADAMWARYYREYVEKKMGPPLPANAREIYAAYCASQNPAEMGQSPQQVHNSNASDPPERSATTRSNRRRRKRAGGLSAFPLPSWMPTTAEVATLHNDAQQHLLRWIHRSPSTATDTGNNEGKSTDCCEDSLQLEPGEIPPPLFCWKFLPRDNPLYYCPAPETPQVVSSLHEEKENNDSNNTGDELCEHRSPIWLRVETLQHLPYFPIPEPISGEYTPHDIFDGLYRDLYSGHVLQQMLTVARERLQAAQLRYLRRHRLASDEADLADIRTAARAAELSNLTGNDDGGHGRGTDKSTFTFRLGPPSESVKKQYQFLKGVVTRMHLPSLPGTQLRRTFFWRSKGNVLENLPRYTFFPFDALPYARRRADRHVAAQRHIKLLDVLRRTDAIMANRAVEHGIASWKPPQWAQPVFAHFAAYTLKGEIDKRDVTAESFDMLARGPDGTAYRRHGGHRELEVTSPRNLVHFAGHYYINASETVLAGVLDGTVAERHALPFTEDGAAFLDGANAVRGRMQPALLIGPAANRFKTAPAVGETADGSGTGTGADAPGSSYPIPGLPLGAGGNDGGSASSPVFRSLLPTGSSSFDFEEDDLIIPGISGEASEDAAPPGPWRRRVTARSAVQVRQPLAKTHQSPAPTVGDVIEKTVPRRTMANLLYERHDGLLPSSSDKAGRREERWELRHQPLRTTDPQTGKVTTLWETKANALMLESAKQVAAKRRTRSAVERHLQQRELFRFRSPYWVRASTALERWGVPVMPSMPLLYQGNVAYVNAENTADASRFNPRTCSPRRLHDVLSLDGVTAVSWEGSCLLREALVQARRMPPAACLPSRPTYAQLEAFAAAINSSCNFWLDMELVRAAGWHLRVPEAVVVEVWRPYLSDTTPEGSTADDTSPQSPPGEQHSSISSQRQHQERRGTAGHSGRQSSWASKDNLQPRFRRLSQSEVARALSSTRRKASAESIISARPLSAAPPSPESEVIQLVYADDVLEREEVCFVLEYEPCLYLRHVPPLGPSDWETESLVRRFNNFTRHCGIDVAREFSSPRLLSAAAYFVNPRDGYETVLPGSSTGEPNPLPCLPLSTAEIIRDEHRHFSYLIEGRDAERRRLTAGVAPSLSGGADHTVERHDEEDLAREEADTDVEFDEHDQEDATAAEEERCGRDGSFSKLKFYFTRTRALFAWRDRTMEERRTRYSLSRLDTDYRKEMEKKRVSLKALTTCTITPATRIRLALLALTRDFDGCRSGIRAAAATETEDLSHPLIYTPSRMLERAPPQDPHAMAGREWVTTEFVEMEQGAMTRKTPHVFSTVDVELTLRKSNSHFDCTDPRQQRRIAAEQARLQSSIRYFRNADQAFASETFSDARTLAPKRDGSGYTYTVRAQRQNFTLTVSLLNKAELNWPSPEYEERNDVFWLKAFPVERP